MTRQRSQYKRNPKLKAEFSKTVPIFHETYKRYSAWKNVLTRGLTPEAIHQISDLLSRLDFEPDEIGIPVGNWPPAFRVDTLVLLDALLGSKSDDEPWRDTLEWKADVLEAATLVWAGAIEKDENQFREACPLARFQDVALLLEYSDLDSFWRKPGRGKTKEDIREYWKRGERIVDQESLRKKLKR